MQITFRVPDDVAKALDAAATRKSRLVGVTITRTQLLLAALREWLESQPNIPLPFPIGERAKGTPEL